MNDSYNIKNLSKDNLKKLINNQHIFYNIIKIGGVIFIDFLIKIFSLIM